MVTVAPARACGEELERLCGDATGMVAILAERSFQDDVKVLRV